MMGDDYDIDLVVFTHEKPSISHTAYDEIHILWMFLAQENGFCNLTSSQTRISEKCVCALKRSSEKKEEAMLSFGNKKFMSGIVILC